MMAMNNMNDSVVFVPYEKIIIGGNEISCRYLVNINKFYPIIIGEGETPRIWLYAIVNDKIITLVNDNKVIHHRIKVSIDKTAKSVSIVLIDNPNPDYVILFADYKKEKVFNIKKMDLNPIGLSIISNENELMVGKNHISGNVVKGVDSFISLSDK